MKYKLLCDYRENFESFTDVGHINDHQDKETFLSILDAIRQNGYDCDIFEGVPALLDAINNNEQFDNTIFLNLSDGMSQKYSRVQIPILCELLKVPYSGGNAFTVALTSNKFYTKLAVEKMNIKTPPAILVTKKNLPDQLTLKTLRYPLMVKPNTEGSSVGITDKSICKTEPELHTRLHQQLQIFDEVLIEEFIPGYDVTDFVIGNRGEYLVNEPLIAIKRGKIISGMDIMSCNDYIHRDNAYSSPNKYIPLKCVESIRKNSLLIVENLKAYDIARIDYRVSEDGKIYFLEINTVPAIHKKSQAGAICDILGIPFSEFVNRWVSCVFERITG